MANADCSFDRYGDGDPASPVVLSVPHSGRDYPLALRAALRVPVTALRPLEDRYIDLVALAAHDGETMLVQQRARAWIDLNRSEQERDPAIDDGASAQALPRASAKLRGGLGLIPRRIASVGEIWRRRLDAEDVAARIVGDHRPYHAALEAALRRARARFGVAVLLDIHSMPTIKGGARIVLGDRFGRSAGARFVHRIEHEVRAQGVALNTPYAGGFILDQHGAPARNIHAIQIEFDRALYLDARLDMPGTGLESTAGLLRWMIDAVAEEALGGPSFLAAE